MKMKFLLKLIIFFAIGMLIACHKGPIKPSVVDESRVIKVRVKCRTFDNSIKTFYLRIFDVTADSVKKIFSELFNKNFPIYTAYGYANRSIVNDTKASLHAYGAAIDVNEHMNPYYNVVKGTSSIVPKRFVDRTIDKEIIANYLKTSGLINKTELNATMNAIIQKSGSDDWFINRAIYRKGMLTHKEVEVFERNGFTIWGGTWKQPMDFMHFQIPRRLAENLANASQEDGNTIWKNHLLISKCHLQLKKKLEPISKKNREIIWIEHLNSCQFDGDYLAAANKEDTTSICLKDCLHKCDKIGAMILQRSMHHK